jgi:hypothetical protein
MSRRKRTCTVSVALTVVCAAFMLTGCSSTTPGSAMPAVTGPASSSPSSSAASGSVFGTLQACDVLGPITNALGFNPGKRTTNGGPNGCIADKARYGAISLSLDDGRTINDLVVGQGQVSTTQVAGRDARILTGSLGPTDTDCDIAVAVGSHARALMGLSLTGSTGTEQTCTVLKPLAEQMMQKLPQGN